MGINDRDYTREKHPSDCTCDECLNRREVRNGNEALIIVKQKRINEENRQLDNEMKYINNSFLQGKSRGVKYKFRSLISRIRHT